MKPARLPHMSLDELVEAFTSIALDQDHAILMDDNKRYNRLYWQMDALKEELKHRAGDQRRALMALYEHPNEQVRLAAAKATLAVAPEAARQMLETIAEPRNGPQSGDAGMCLRALDDGTFKPT